MQPGRCVVPALLVLAALLAPVPAGAEERAAAPAATARFDPRPYLMAERAEDIACARRGPDLPPGSPSTVRVRLVPGDGGEFRLALPGGVDRAAVEYRLMLDEGGSLFLLSATYRDDLPGGAGEGIEYRLEPPLALCLPDAAPHAERASAHRLVPPDPGDGAPDAQPFEAFASHAVGRVETPGGVHADALSLAMRFSFPERTADDPFETRTESLVFARGIGFAHRRVSVDPETAADDETLDRVAAPPASPPAPPPAPAPPKAPAPDEPPPPAGDDE